MATPHRLDLYAHIHKALRLFMTDTLQRLGTLDIDDPVDLAAGLAQLDALLQAADHHVQRENDFIHPALEARSPGASAAIGGEHREHLDTIAALRAEAIALRALPSDAAAERLYRHVAAFVAENFLHMGDEETRHNQVLWAHYADAELHDLHGRLVASVTPQEMRELLHWMMPALNPAERAVVVASLPTAAQAPVLAATRPLLNDVAWTKLCRALGQAPVPGLATV